MRFSRNSGALGLTALAIIASTFAQAQDTGWYAGANVGQSKAKIDDSGITGRLLGEGFTSITLDDHSRDTGFKVFAGYEFTRYLSVEGGYFNLGRFSYVATTFPPGTLNGDIRLQGLNLDGVLSLPITQRFSAFGRAGLTCVGAKDAFSGSGQLRVLDPNPKKTSFDGKFGGGLQYDFTRAVGMRAEVERYRVPDAVGNQGDIDLYSLGLLVRFGRKEPAAQAAATPAPAPAPVEPIAAEPVLVVVPVAQQTQEYCTILDLEFAIDQDDIRREDKENLAVLGNFLVKYPDTTAVIEGHSDNVGTPEHNRQLSQHRADNVVGYLVNTLHIAPARLSAVGYGDTRPVADNATEAGKRQNRRVDAVIACVTDVAGLKVVPARMTMALYIDFDQNKADLKPEYDNQLQQVADFMKANPLVTATVEGHTANLKGTPALALEVSQHRAQNVVNYLAEHLGIERTRMSARGYGGQRRVAYNTSTEGARENRRVNIIFNYPK